MRVDNAVISQTMIESQKPIEKKELSNILLRDGENSGDLRSFIPSPFGSSGTYSISSLRSAVDHHAKFLTVAENNVEAANHTGKLPQLLLDRLNAKLAGKN